MGQGSSQPQDGELPELEGHEDGDAMLQKLMDSVTVAKKGKSKVQVEGTPAPKRKRKSSLNNTSDGKTSTLSTKSQLSSQSPAVSHPSKRTKLAPSGVSTKDARKLEKKSSQEAILSPELPNGVNSMENEATLAQIPNAQPPASTVHTNGAVKKIKKSKAKSAQKSEEEESLALSPTAIESKTPITTLESTDQSAMDTSSDQKDPIDTSDAVRGPRPGKKAKLVGFFAPAEVRALEEFKLDFCTRNALSSDSFDRMVQHVDRRKDSGWPCDEAIANKTEFWQAIYDVLPGRDRRSVYRFMRRHFQDSSQKPHHWTHDQDEELIRMVGQYGPKFAHIAKMLGRGEDDVVQRWKNRLEHRSTMRRGAWSEEEVRGLLDALQAAWVALKKDGKDVGLDIYEMDEGLISWGQVSNKLDNWRSRQQCADKWRKIRRKIMGLRSSGVKDAVFDPASEARPQGRAKSITLAEQMEMEKVYKSAEYVNSDDGNESEPDSLGANKSQASKQAQKQNINPEPAGSKVHSLPVLPKPTAISSESESEATSESCTGSSDDGSESEPEIKADPSSGSSSSAGPNSDDEMNGKVDPRIIAQDKKLKSKSMKDQQNTPNKKPNSVAQAKGNDKQTAKSIEKLKVKDQTVKKSDSNPSAYVIQPNAIAHGKVSEQHKSLGQKKEVPHEASSESESGSSSESGVSDSDSNSSAETDSDSASDSEISPVQKVSEPIAKSAEKKTSAITQKANEKLKGPQRSEKGHRNTQSSAETSSASSEDGSTEDSANSGDETDDSDAKGSIDVTTTSLKAAPAKDPKRKIQPTTQAPEKHDIKRLKTDSKSSRDSSSPSSSSATSSAADSESKSGDSEDNASQESDTSSSESSGSRSESETESESKSESESESESDSKVHSKTKQNGRRLQPALGVMERSDLKSGKSVASKSKPKSAQPSSPIVKDVGAKTKGKSRLVSSTKKKASK